MGSWREDYERGCEVCDDLLKAPLTASGNIDTHKWKERYDRNLEIAKSMYNLGAGGVNYARDMELSVSMGNDTYSTIIKNPIFKTKARLLEKEIDESIKHLKHQTDKAQKLASKMLKKLDAKA